MKAKTKRIIAVVATVLIASFALILLGNLSGGFQNWETDEWKLRKLNPKNLYNDLTFAANAEGVLADGSTGIFAEIDEDNNVIEVEGTAETDTTIVVGTCSLKAGSYVFDSSMSNGTKGTVYMSVVNSSTGEELAASYRGPVVFSVSADTNVKVQVSVNAETKVDLTLKPILCEGKETSDLVGYYK